MGECFELWLFVHVSVCVLNIIIRSPACHMHIYIFYDCVHFDCTTMHGHAATI